MNDLTKITATWTSLSDGRFDYSDSARTHSVTVGLSAAIDEVSRNVISVIRNAGVGDNVDITAAIDAEIGPEIFGGKPTTYLSALWIAIVDASAAGKVVAKIATWVAQQAERRALSKLVGSLDIQIVGDPTTRDELVAALRKLADNIEAIPVDDPLSGRIHDGEVNLSDFASLEYRMVMAA